VRAVQYVDQETGTAVGEVPDPAPGPDDVIVAVEACGLCGSDVHSVQNGRLAPGQIVGHEFSGRIAALGANVAGWAEGQPVAATPIGSCGQCLSCRKGVPFRCPNVPNVGITAPGAYAQYVRVPARQLVGLPDELPVDVGSHAEPLSVGSQAVKLASVQPGEPVLVYGVGPIVAAGRSAGRRQAAADVGADVVIDTREISVADYAKQSGTEFAAALECSAAPGAFNECLSVLGPAGTVVEVALTPEEPKISLYGILGAGQRIVGACAFDDTTYRESVEHLAAGRVPTERLVSERVSLDDTPDALRRLQTPGTLVRIISRPQA
jgi:threonine dehydrogenase-like Zn-dependent dehydrogenase